MLDRFERDHPDVRVVRLRPGLIFKREAATRDPPLLPWAAAADAAGAPPLIPVVPRHAAPALPGRPLATTSPTPTGAPRDATPRRLQRRGRPRARPDGSRERSARGRCPCRRGCCARGRDVTWRAAPAADAAGLGRHGARRADHGHARRARERARLGAAPRSTEALLELLDGMRRRRRRADAAAERRGRRPAAVARVATGAGRRSR